MYSNLKILRVDDLFKYAVGCVIYKSCSNISPFPIQQLFLPISDNNNYNLRQNKRLLTKPQFTVSRSCRAISWLGPQFYNSLPNYLKCANSYNSFKNMLKIYLLNKIE